MPLAERLKHFEEIWKILTKDSEILEHVEGYQIPFNKKQGHQKIPEIPHINLRHRTSNFYKTCKKYLYQH